MNSRYFEMNGKVYYLDVQKMIDFCLISENKNVRDNEITEGYEKLSDDSNVLTLTSRVIREASGVSNPQNDMITYDLFKMCLSILLGQEAGDTYKFNISFAIAFNTLVELEVLKEK
jgi:hypothetical protein